MRHLRTGKQDERTLCGLLIEGPEPGRSRVVRPSAVEGAPGHVEQVVHFSKARGSSPKTRAAGFEPDCSSCRLKYREYRRTLSAGPPSDAATATGMYDHDDVN